MLMDRIGDKLFSMQLQHEFVNFQIVLGVVFPVTH